MEVEGTRDAIGAMLVALQNELPPHASILTCEVVDVPVQGDSTFEIRPSEASGAKTALILPDLAVCEACLSEMTTPGNRRYRYPFINCTHCGPRYSIMTALPYDRLHTTMHTFTMCADCIAEYQDPTHRRFHAQPNACPVCGPHIELWDTQGKVIATHDEALMWAVDAIRGGGDFGVERAWRVSSGGRCTTRGGDSAVADAQTPTTQTLCGDVPHIRRADASL